MSFKRNGIAVVALSVLLAAAIGLGIWWYVYNYVVLNVEKEF